MSKLLHQIALTKTPNVGPVIARNLISYCGSAEAVFSASKRSLLTVPGVGEKMARAILEKDSFKEAEAEIRFLEQEEVTPLFYTDDNYPRRLRHTDHAPLLLYYKGTVNLNYPRIVAIVGTRKPSPQSKAICEELVADLQAYDTLIVSGLAYGIDVAAHRKSVELNIPTVGVLGHGLRQIYPAAHRQIATEMLENGGLLTEFTHKKKPDASHFPMRNRIVAGMSDAVVVVETGIKGGSMITAQYGNEYSKDVFAFPGRTKDVHLQGCNSLIKTHRAALIESAADIGYIMRWEPVAPGENRAAKWEQLDGTERVIVNLLREKEEVGIDELVYQSQINQSEVASLLLTLEFKGLVKTLPGKRYMLLR